MSLRGCCDLFRDCLASTLYCVLMGFRYMGACLCSFCHYGGDPDDCSEALPPWRILWIEFVNRTTWHGLKYLELRSRFLLRKIIWSLIMMTNFCIFVYITYTKALNLTSNPTSLSLSINHLSTIQFPAVTICNMNKYRMSALQKNNLYDLLAMDADKDNSCDYCKEYVLFSQIESIPELDPPFKTYEFSEINRHVCMKLCSTVYESFCSSFLYYRFTRLCKLTSYTGEWVVSNRININESVPAIEFYRRKRSLILEIWSSFEYDNPFYSSLKNDKETWIRIEASNLRIKKDNTLALGSGYVMNMPTQDNYSGGFTASLITPYLNISELCLSFAYWIDVPIYQLASNPSIIIYTENEELERNILLTETSILDYWKNIQIKLPNGIYRVIIVGKRSDYGSNGISIDDISIKSCSSLKNNCLENFYGNGYLGETSIDSNNNKCEPWILSDTNPSLLKLPEGIKESLNYCRYLAGEGWTSPSCFVRGVDGDLFISACSIPYCTLLDAKYESQMYSCKSNQFKIPKKLTCDGSKDCIDGSDEIDNCNSSISCVFSDTYICGYQQDDSSNFKWIQTSISDLSDYQDTVLSRNMSKMADVLIFTSSVGEYGNKVLIFSPIQYFSRPTKFIISSMLKASYFDDLTDLYIYLLSSFLVPIQILAELNYLSSTFISTTICIPPGYYGLAFAGVHRSPKDQYIALANVEKLEEECTFLSNLMENSSINCSFSTLCGYTVYSMSMDNIYSFTFIDGDDFNVVATDLVCGKIYDELSAYIKTPNYPSSYPPNLNCSFTISNIFNATIELSFEHFNLEPQNDCRFDYLEIFSNCDDIMQRLCGNYTNLSFSFNCSSIQLKLITDGENNFFGFTLFYRMLINKNIKTALLFTNTVVDSGSGLISDSNKIFLYSPPTYLPKYACLSVRLKANSIFRIHLLQDKKFNEYNIAKKTIFDSVIRPGSEYNWYNITILKDSFTSVNVSFVFMYEFFVAKNVQLISEISEVLLIDEICRNKYFFGSINCDFNDINQCGYLDMSYGPTNWIRSYDIQSKSYSMRAYFKAGGIYEAVLQSVQTLQNNISCLTIHYMTLAHGFGISLWTNPQEKRINFTLSKGISKISHTLPIGSFTLLIYAYLDQKITIEKDVSEIRIYELILNDGKCINKEYLSLENIYCDFSACEKCILNFEGPEGVPWSCASLQYIFENDKNFKNDSINLKGNAMIYNITSNNVYQKGIFVTMFAQINTPSVLKFQVFTSFVNGTILDVYMTTRFGLISNKLGSFTFLESYVWQNFSVCLPIAYTRIVFVVKALSGYVLLNYLNVFNERCTPLPNNDCNNANLATCISNYHVWTLDYKWLVSNDNGKNINAGDACFKILNNNQGIWIFNEKNNKTQENDVLCEIYIVGKYEIKVQIQFDIFEFEDCSKQYIEIWKRDDQKAKPDKIVICPKKMLQNLFYFTTFETLQLRVISLMKKTPMFKLSYNYSATSYENYSMRLQGEDYIKNGFATWISPVYSTLSKSICFKIIADIHFINLTGYIFNENSKNKIPLFSTLKSTGKSNWFGSQFEFKMDQSNVTNISNAFQIILIFEWSENKEQKYVLLKNISIDMNKCHGDVNYDLLPCSSNLNECNYFDISQTSSRWFYANEILVDNINKDDCSISINENEYNGNINYTFSGRICQRWSSQFPHEHIQNRNDFFTNSTMNEVGNKCRNPINPYILRTSWCYTMDASVRREFCNIPQCIKEYFMVMFLPKEISTSTISSPFFNTLNKAVCLSFSLFVDSNFLKVKVFSLLNNIKNELMGVFFKPSSWQTIRTNIPINSTKLYFEVTKLDFSFEVVSARITNIHFDSRTCFNSKTLRSVKSTLEREVYNGPRLPRTFYFNYVYDDFKAKTMADLTPILSHNYENLIYNCSFSNQLCDLTPELTSLGDCVQLNMLNNNIVKFPGSTFGARLILNVEQYDHVKLYVQGVGVKIQAWMPGNVQFVDDMGIEAKTGMHNQAMLSYSQASFLTPPYGSCGTVPLLNFPSNEVYTEEKCRTNYRTEQSLLDCNCRREYLPGSSKVCNLEQYVNCSSQKTDKSSLENNCISACLYDIFDIQQSGLGLSPLSLQSILFNKNFQVQKNLVDAMELRNRVVPEIMSDLISRLNGYINYLSLLNDYILSHIADSSMSPLGNLETRLNNIWSKNYETIISFVTKMFDKAKYLMNEEYTPIYIDVSLQELEAYIDMFMNSNLANVTLNQSLISLITKLNIWNSTKSSKSCNDQIIAIKDSIEIYLNMNLFLNQANFKEITKYLNLTKNNIINFKNCQDQFTTNVEYFRSYITILQNKQYLRNYTFYITVSNLLLLMQEQQEFVTTLMENYSTNIITKQVLANELIPRLESTSDLVSTMIQLLWTTVLNPFFTKILDARIDVTNFHQNMDNKWQVQDLQEFKKIENELQGFVNELNTKINTFNQLTLILINNMTDYLNSLLINQNFIESNFMLLDIFYGQMTYNNFTTSISYTWINFASDMGSYMNLLMGCSLLTMVEVLDLFIYHSIVKIYELYDGRKSRRKKTVIEIPLPDIPPGDIYNRDVSGLKYL